MLINKRKAHVSVVTALTFLLTACGGTGNQPSTSEPVKDQPKAANGPADLVFYSNSSDTVESFDTRFGNAIRKKFPNYTIKYIQKAAGQTLPDLIAAGTPIDIYWESVGQFLDGTIQYNMQFDMTDLIKKYNIDLNRFEPTTIDAMRTISNGKMYALPVSNNNLALFYNKDIFDKFGIPYLKDGVTWDEVLEVAKQLTRNDSGKQYVGLGVSPAHVLRLNPYSQPFVDPKTEKPTINNDKWKTIFETAFIRPAEFAGYREKIVADQNKLPATQTFVNDKTLGMYVFLSFFYSVTDLSSMNWDMVSYPTYKDAPNIGSQSYPTYFSVTSTSKYKDQAMDVIQYLVSDEFQMELSKQGVMTVLKNEQVKAAFGQNTNFKDKNLKSVFLHKFAPISPKTPYDAEAERIYRLDLVNLSLGTTDINTTFRKAEEETVKAIDKLRKK